MGSRPLSDIGSRLACQAVLAATRQCSFDTPNRDLILCIYKNWLHTLGNVTPNDAVATCLVAWGLASGECRLLQLGDGMISCHGETSEQLSHRSENGFANETTGLGISRRISDWQCRTVKLHRPGQGIVLTTDGISDDIDDTAGFTEAIITRLRGKGIRYSKRWMTRELENWPTPKHTDDKTIAVIYRT